MNSAATPMKPSSQKNSVDTTEATQQQQQDNTPQTDIPLVTTTQTMLELVLGEVVEIVVDAERNRSDLNVDRLQQLLQFPDLSTRNSPSSDTLSLTHAELQQMVLRVVVAAKTSVRRNTPKPTGIRSKRRSTVVNLSWAAAINNNNNDHLPSPPPRMDEIVLGERVCI